MASITTARPGLRSATLYWLGFIFTGLALIQLGLVRQEFSPNLILALLALMLCAGGVEFLFRRQGFSGDPILLPLIYFLSGLGLALTARLAPAFIIRQLVWLVIATALLLAVILTPRNLSWFRRFKYAWLSGGLLLLATTLFWGVNPSGFGARLWLQFGSMYFQPSEPLKLFLIVFLAAYLADRRRQLVEINAYFPPLPVPFPHPSYFGPMFIMWAISIILLIWQRDLGAALLFFGTFVGMLYAATGQRRYVWAGVLLLFAAGVIGYYLFDVVRLRVESFWNPWQDPAGRSFQIVQSLLAFASGGFLGQGLGQGLPTAIPVVHTDFVFAAMGEEYGLIGTVGVLTCFALLVNRAFHIGLQAKHGFEQLLAVGIGLMFGLQTVVIMAGTLKLMPLTGVTLPFVSYGGSSLVTSFLMVGVLMFISRRPATAERVASPVPRPDPGPYLHLMRGFFVAFSIIGGGLIFWQIALAPQLLARDDNPRPIITEQTIRRGRLLTADGVPIAETVFNQDGLAERRYPYPGLASVTGYYSLRYGVGGTEATFDPVLRGVQGRTAQEVWLDQLLHRSLVGQDVTVTINLPAQVAADVALGNREGGVVIMDLHTGAILVMSSQPTYDPNLLDETWDDLRDAETAPLLNRATQGLFPVGDLARLIGLIGLYEAKILVPPDPATAPLEAMLGPLGESGYLATTHQLGLTRSIAGVRSQPGLLPDFDDKGTVRDLAVTPLHMARVVAALELEGALIDPVLSLNRQVVGGRPAIRAESARQSRALLAQVNARVVGLTGLATPEETGKESLSWFVGLAPATASTLPGPNPTTKLILDPTKITPTPQAPTPTIQPAAPTARYVVVAVVVVAAETERDAAFRVANASLQPLLK